MIMTSADPRVVHRYLELHAERLEERVAAQRLVLMEVESILGASTARTTSDD